MKATLFSPLLISCLMLSTTAESDSDSDSDSGPVDPRIVYRQKVMDAIGGNTAERQVVVIRHLEAGCGSAATDPYTTFQLMR